MFIRYNSQFNSCRKDTSKIDLCALLFTRQCTIEDFCRSGIIVMKVT